MPLRTQSPCRSKGCNSLHRNANGYCAAHADQAKAFATCKPSSRGGRPWRRLRDKIMKRDSYLCQCSECKKLGRLREAHEVDHIIALANGGTDDPANLQAINRDCHRLKSQMDIQARRRRG